MSLVLGLNAYHGDSSACLVRDGELIAAAEEERFRRVKHWAGFPSEAIRYCLDEGHVTLDQVAHVAINQDSKAHFWRKVRFTLAHRPDAALILDKIRNRGKRAGIEQQLLTEVGPSFRGEVHHVEHHLAHLGSAFLVSPFDQAVVVSVDGFGDFASAAWAIGRGNAVESAGKVFFPHSLGIFYQALTQYLGFPKYGDEYKVMGLAPYGEPRYLKEMQEIVNLLEDGTFALCLKYFRHHQERVAYEWAGGEPEVGRLFTADMIALLGPPREAGAPLTQKHWDIACSVQAMYEKAFFHLLNALHHKYGIGNLALAGGCAMNSVANGKVYRRTPFKRVYVQAAAGDAGGAIGAAMTVWHQSGGRRLFRMDHAYLGPGFASDEIAQVLELNAQSIEGQGCTIDRIGEEGVLCAKTARAISDGKVVGWFQGRMEWGPRALGNRSILGDPRRMDMKDVLNLKIKRRESFRPFAPSILREAVRDWFEEDDDVPFMMQVHQIRENKRTLIPAVTHVDGSGRLQTVECKTNPLYYRLIDAFRELTGVPMLLNTSFNESEPIVCKPQEALDCFLRTKMDMLVMEDWVINRHGTEN